MSFINYASREINCKIVYYGPGLCGKTTNLQFIYDHTTNESRGEMVSLETQTDRTLFFDFLPIDLGEIRGMKTRVQLYTVPGQVFYNATRRMVLKGADAVVFVCDSQEAMLDAMEARLDEPLRVAIAGKVKAGKSTLLKILTGVISPSRGTVEVNARMAALLELGSSIWSRLKVVLLSSRFSIVSGIFRTIRPWTASICSTRPLRSTV